MDLYLFATILSLLVALSGAFIGFVVAIPIAGWIALGKFRAQALVEFLIFMLMAMPSVIIGLLVYLLLSHWGWLGFLELIYTPTAMIFAQILLILPLMIGFLLPIMKTQYESIGLLLESLRVNNFRQIIILIHEVRYQLAGVFLTGYGRALAEVGAVMIVGGNINHETRVLTTSIILEISKGNLDIALNYGMILMSLAFMVNLLAFGVQKWR